ncbi:isopropylmalate isomerase [Aurantiacibacter spongiae]|uniref:Isopropylmalate isomerase n=1 Tax=Aurantiacibacter spongiae TaxID=2488860 RepID=A0A3N5CTT0_9SPHN|nr:isopropylmalate isomerase [Aurantiacibacter spongiae]RPF72107.1 isopropylmalate isomerase [Aurantiacibacter spongiae]
MTQRIPSSKAAIATAAIGSAVAAAMLYTTRQRRGKDRSAQINRVPNGENPETD